MTALLRGNFGSLVDFAEIFHTTHAVLSQKSLEVLRCLKKKYSVLFMENFHKTLLGWKNFTTKGFVEKVLKKVALLEHFQKTLFS